jgi:hypothetical protein
MIKNKGWPSQANPYFLYSIVKYCRTITKRSYGT